VDTNPNDLDLKAIIALLRRQIRLIVLTVAVFLGVALIYLFSVTPMFTASTLILVDPAQRNLLDPTEPLSVSATAADARVDSEVEILRSDAIALAVLDNQNLLRDPEFGPQIGLMDRVQQAVGFEVETRGSGEALVQGVLRRFGDAVSVRRVGLTYIISVSVESEDPDRAARLANALAETFIAAQVEAKVAVSLTARDALLGQSDAALQAVSDSEDALDTFIEVNLAELEAESGLSEVAELRRLVDQVNEQRLTAEASTLAAQQALQAGDWATLSDRLGDEALSELDRQRQQLESRLAAATSGSQEEIDLRQALARVEAESVDRADSVIGVLRSEVADLEATARDYRTQIREVLLQGELSSAFLTAMYELQQEASIARRQYQTLLSRQRDLETQANIQVADSRIVAPALPPAEPTFPNSRLILAVTLVLAVGAGVGFAFLREYYVGGVTSADQLRDILHARVATSIPKANQGVSQLSLADNVISSPLSLYAESIRRLRATIDQSFRIRNPRGEHTGADPAGKVIMITSGLPYEGKTTTALALARTYALAGIKTLLIDADLRRPTLHKQLGLTPEQGFADYLRDLEIKRVASSFYGRDAIANLSVVMGARRSETPTDQLLDSAAFDELIRHARDDFDIVILDTPPLIPVVDARYVAHYADAAIMLVRYSVAHQRDIRSAAAQLQEALHTEAEFFAVLNQEQGRQRSYSYYGYYSDEYAENT